MKMNHSDSYGLGTFEALEFLRLGIHGKAALWQALARIASHYEALARVDFQRLSKRAQIQEDEVERYRVSLADQALVAQDTSSPPKDSRLDMAHRGRALANRHTVAQGVTDEAGHDIENPT
jgi:ABC-type hemin transport system ATPase subunit